MGDKKMGRPTDKPKDYMLRVRMDKDTLSKLDKLCKDNKKTRSEVVRDCINEKSTKN